MGLRSMVVAPYESATDVDINASLEKRAGDRFEQVDLVTRRTLAVFGALSGRAGGVSIDTLRIPSIVYHGFLCLLYMTNLVVSLLVAWDKTEESIASIMMKTAIICWYTVGVSDSISGFIISHWKGGLPNYQEELSLAADEMEQCGIEIDHNRIRKFLSVTYQIGVAVSLAGVTIKVLDFTSVINIDAIYGISLKDRIEDRDTLKVAQIFGLVVSVIMNFISTLGPLFLVQTCQILRRLFLDFDRHLERLVTSSQTELQQKLPALRLVYCRLRELVQCANAWVSVFSAGIFLVSVVDCLVIIFVVAKTEKFVLADFIAYAYWVGYSAAILVTVITYADKMSRETSEAHGILVKWKIEEKSANSRTGIELNLFVAAAAAPEPVTLFYLLDINKDLGLTLVGVMLSYYLVMDQIGSPNQTDAFTCLCNCTGANSTA